MEETFEPSSADQPEEKWLTLEEAAKLFFRDRPAKFSIKERRPASLAALKQVIYDKELRKTRPKNFKTINGVCHIRLGGSGGFDIKKLQFWIYCYYDSKVLLYGECDGRKTPSYPNLDKLERIVK
jgi:hypothetical protein